MCTVSWWRRNGKLSLWFNRDEQKERPLAEAPRVQDGLIWPRDPRGGGTWICVDKQGTVHCLLNNYDAGGGEGAPGLRSRGALPLLSAKHNSLPVSGWVEPDKYPPFHLIRIPLTGEGEHAIWDMRQLRTLPVQSDLKLWTTSGWNARAVVDARSALFEHMIASCGLSEETLERFHTAFDEADPGRWPLMMRENAHTVSISNVLVNEKQISFCYRPLGDHDNAPATQCIQTRVPLEK